MKNVADDVIRHYFDVAGDILSWDGDDQLFAVSVDQVRRVPLVVGIAVAPDKDSSIRRSTRWCWRCRFRGRARCSNTPARYSARDAKMTAAAKTTMPMTIAQAIQPHCSGRGCI